LQGRPWRDDRRASVNEPEISPLAKRLAEENNVNWRALAGSGAGGKVVERDVLEYLARVMAGEEDTDPTPEPLPEGIDSWPEDDIVAYQDEIRPAQETPGLDTLQAELSASERSLGNTGSTDMLADAGVTDAGVTDASATDASATDASGNATAHLPDHLSGMEDDEDLWQDVGGAHEESTSGIEFAPLEPVADETPAPPAEEKFEDEDISEDIFLFGEGDVAEMEEMQETPAVDDDIPAAVAPEEFGSSSGGEEETIDPFAAAVEAGEVSSEAPPEVTGDDAVAGMDFEAPSQRDDVWRDHDDGAAGEGVQAAAESASYQDASEDVEKADPYTFETPAEVSPTDDAAALQGEQAVGDKEVARGTGTEEELFAPLDAAVDFSPAQAPVEEDRTTDRATDVFASADAGREPESEETDVFLSEPTDADTAATPTPADVDWFAGGGEQMPITGEMPSESEESSIEAEKPDEMFEWGGEAAAATSEMEFAPAEPRVPGDEIVSPADTPAPQEEAAPEEYGQDPDQGAAEVSPASVMSEGTSAIVDEERVDRTDTSFEEQEDETFEHDEVVNAGVGTDLGSVVRQSATGAPWGLVRSRWFPTVCCSGVTSI